MRRDAVLQGGVRVAGSSSGPEAGLSAIERGYRETAPAEAIPWPQTQARENETDPRGPVPVVDETSARTLRRAPAADQCRPV